MMQEKLPEVPGWTRLLGVWAGVGLSLLVAAQTALGAHNGHEPLATSATLDFAAIFDSALAAIPEYQETPVRETQASDYADAAQRWIYGQPSLQMNYYDDSTLDNVGLREFEYGIQLPLWRPGQRQASRQLGERYNDQVETWKTDLEWLVAGRVRGALAAMAKAELGLSLQTQAVADAERLVNVTQTLFEAGEVARAELLQAQGLLAEKQADLLQAEAAMVDAERAYVVITRLDVRPVTVHTETLTSQEDIDDTHPRLQYLRSGVDLALANVRQSENSVKGNPTLTIGTRREQPDRSTAPVSSFGIQLSIPFGGGSYVSAQTSAARRARVDAEVEYLNTYTQLNQALHEVEHDLFISEQEEPLRRTQAELNRERFNMALAAYEVGETTLVQVVMAQQQAQESDHALQSLLRERERLITEFNQLIGVMP